MPFWQHSGTSYPDEENQPTCFPTMLLTSKEPSSYLKEELELIKSVEVQNFVTQEYITWHFIPPTAAHVGGLWEAGMKSTKQLLIKTMKSAVLNFEELVTLVTQIEACLNSRPLTPLSNDPQDLQPLTPGHFLIGAPMASFPEEVPSQPACLKKRWNLIQHLRSQFWKEMAPGVPKSITTKNQVE
ncbi:integrase catalytic domain-containing protein [Trichonephila clavipes]|nr:integrase catalytic domain-containing protein [Trichonephila clavipes]